MCQKTRRLVGIGKDAPKKQKKVLRNRKLSFERNKENVLNVCVMSVFVYNNECRTISLLMKKKTFGNRDVVV